MVAKISKNEMKEVLTDVCVQSLTKNAATWRKAIDQAKKKKARITVAPIIMKIFTQLYQNLF